LAVEQGSDEAARKRVAATPGATPPGVGPGGATQAGAVHPGHGPLPREAVIVLGLSGRGDKDLAALGSAQSRAALAETGGRNVSELGDAQLLATPGLKEVGR